MSLRAVRRAEVVLRAAQVALEAARSSDAPDTRRVSRLELRVLAAFDQLEAALAEQRRTSG